MAFGTRIKTLGGTKSSISLDELIDGSANIKTVRDNKSIQSVIDSITDATADNPYVVNVPPGHENESFTGINHVRVTSIGGPQNVITVHNGQTIQSVIDSITDASVHNLYEVIIPANRIHEIWVNAVHITVTTFGHAVEIPAYTDDNAAIKDGLAGDRFYHVAGDAKILAKKILIMKDADADQSINIILSLPVGKSLVIDHGDTSSTNVSGPQTETTYAINYSDALAHEILISGDLNSISYFRIQGEPISKIYNLLYLTSLSTLYLHGNSLTDVGDLSYLTSLSTLSLQNNSLTDVGDLSNLTSLTYLNLYGNSLTDVGDLSNLTSLTYLSLYSNSLTDVGDLSNLTSLTYLSLYGNSLTDVGDLSNLTSLTHLNLYSNSLTDVGDLSNLTSLSTLYLHGNSLTDVGDLSYLTSLSTLSLQNNSLTDVGDLSNLTSLSTLYLQNNSFSQSELSDYIDQNWINRVALGGNSCAIKIESNASTPSCDVDAVAKIEGNTPYTGDGLKDAGCTVTYDA